jgi:hypothetical protein
MNRPFEPSLRAWLVLPAIAFLALACGDNGDEESPEPSPTLPAAQDNLPSGAPLSADRIQELAAFFSDQPLTGGQVAPRSYKWVTEDVAMFLQFDRPNPAEATALRYIGISVKGVFCVEAQPDEAFTHFHQLDAPAYAEGHGGEPGEEGYWLMWVAVDEFEVQGREVNPGVDYGFSPTPPPACGADVPAADFDAPGARRLNPDEIATLASFVQDQPLTGGQVAPRMYGWVNEDVSIFIQWDRGNPSGTAGFNASEATTPRFFGVSVKGEFCQSDLPSGDFPHFHRVNAPTYAEGHGGPPGEPGYWLLWVATDSFDLQGRQVEPGVDRDFARIPIEESC